MNKLFQTPACIGKIETMKDRTMKLIVYISKELASEESSKLFSLNGNEGWFLFSPNDIQPNDVPKENAKVEGRKSASERLYAVLYILWNQEWSGKYPNFNQWREMEMENIINDYKAKLI